MQFSIKTSIATENYKLLQLIIINVIIYYFSVIIAATFNL